MMLAGLAPPTLAAPWNPDAVAVLRPVLLSQAAALVLAVVLVVPATPSDPVLSLAAVLLLVTGLAGRLGAPGGRRKRMLAQSRFPC